MNINKVVSFDIRHKCGQWNSCMDAEKWVSRCYVIVLSAGRPWKRFYFSCSTKWSWTTFENNVRVKLLDKKWDKTTTDKWPLVMLTNKDSLGGLIHDSVLFSKNRKHLF